MYRRHMEIMRRSTRLRYNHYEDPGKCSGGGGWLQIFWDFKNIMMLKIVRIYFKVVAPRTDTELEHHNAWFKSRSVFQEACHSLTDTVARVLPSVSIRCVLRVSYALAVIKGSRTPEWSGLLLMSRVTGLQLLVLSVEVVKPLESGTLVEEVGH